MARRLLMMSCIVSLLLFAATVVLWAMTFYSGDQFAWSRWGRCEAASGTGQAGTFNNNTYFVEWGRGAVSFARSNDRYYFMLPYEEPKVEAIWMRLNPPYRHLRWGAPRDQYPTISIPKLKMAGFDYGITVGSFPGQTWFERRVIVPLWIPVLLFALLPVRALLARGRWRWQWRVRAGLCGACGYDLHASEGRCPECGTPTDHGPPPDPASWRSIRATARLWPMTAVVIVLVTALIEQSMYDRSYPGMALLPWWGSLSYAAIIAFVGILAVKQLVTRTPQ